MQILAAIVIFVLGVMCGVYGTVDGTFQVQNFECSRIIRGD